MEIFCNSTGRSISGYVTVNGACKTDVTQEIFAFEARSNIFRAHVIFTISALILARQVTLRAENNDGNCYVYYCTKSISADMKVGNLDGAA